MTSLSIVNMAGLCLLRCIHVQCCRRHSQ